MSKLEILNKPSYKFSTLELFTLVCLILIEISAEELFSKILNFYELLFRQVLKSRHITRGGGRSSRVV